jgi:hypothetical protein
MTSIVLTHPEIIAFYEANPSVDIVQVNLTLIQLIKPILSTTSESADQIQASIFEKFKTLYTKLDTFTGELNESINNKTKEQTEQFKQILLSTTQEHITPLIRENTNNIIEKTSNIIDKTQKENNVELNFDKHLSIFQNSINQNVSAIIHTNQQFLNTGLVEQDRKINELTTAINTNTMNQQQLVSNVSTILRRFEVGSGKGSLSENVTYNILVDMFPCASVELVSSTKETGDIMVHRPNKPTILIENKDHTTINVTVPEVDKFIRDCTTQNCCGIMMAQHKGISRKQNYEIQINSGNVLLYLHNVNFDAEKIKVAFEIVDQFKTRLDAMAINEEKSVILDVDTLESIHKEYGVYLSQRTAMLKTVKEFSEKMTNSLNDLKLPSIEVIINQHFATSQIQTETVCGYCGKFVKSSVAQHHRHCKERKKALGLLEEEETMLGSGGSSGKSKKK